MVQAPFNGNRSSSFQTLFCQPVLVVPMVFCWVLGVVGGLAGFFGGFSGVFGGFRVYWWVSGGFFFGGFS